MAHATSAPVPAVPAPCQTKICLFCCKVIPAPDEDQSDGYNNATQLLQRFFKILERQLHTKNIKPSTSQSDNNSVSSWTQFLSFLQNQVEVDRENIVIVKNNNGKVKKDDGFLSVECCGDCLEVVETLLTLFHELKCLELKWEWRLDTLLQIMKLGGRVPSRQETLRTLCDNHDNHIEKNQNVSINKAGSSYKRLVSFRRDVIRKCSKRRSKMYPKVILDRLSCPKVEPVPTPQPSNSPTPTSSPISVALPLSSASTSASTAELVAHLQDARATTTKLEIDINTMISFILMILLCSRNNDNSVLELELTPRTQLNDIETGSDFLVEHTEDNQDTNSGTEIANSESKSLLRRYLSMNNNANDNAQIAGHEATIETNITDISTSTTTSIHNNDLVIDPHHFEDDIEEGAVLVDDDGFIYDEHENDHEDYEDATPELENRNANSANEPAVEAEFSVEMDGMTKSKTVAIDNKEKNREAVPASVTDEYVDGDNVNKSVINEVTASTPPSETRRLRTVLRCDKCSKTFSNWKSLEAHKETHVEADATLMEVEVEADVEEDEMGNEDDDDDEDIEMKSEMDEDQKFASSDGSGSDDDDEAEKAEISGNESQEEDEVEFSEKHKKLGKKRKPIRCFEKMDTSAFSYKCDFPNCTVRRPTSDTLLYHKRKVHQVKGVKKKAIRCEKCSTNFGTKFLLFHHQLSVHGDGNEDGDVTLQKEKAKREVEPLQCEIPDCYQRFTLPEELENHSKLHGNFPCGKCDAVFTFAQHLPIHEAKTHCAPLEETMEATMEGKWTPANGFRCLHCETEIKYKSQWKFHYLKHVFTVHMNLPCATLICPICPKTYFPLETKNRGKLRRTHFNHCHDVSSMDPKDVPRCDHEQCQAYFKTAAQLNHHKYRAHPMQFKCHHCEMTFQKRDMRRAHLRQKHDAAFPFACDIENCEIRFPDEEDLAHHKTFYHHFFSRYPAGPHPEKHERRKAKNAKTVKTFVCEQCGKSFKKKENLENHSLWHSGPDSWQFCCETCGKKCMSKQKLAEHVRTHTKEKPFQCEVCGEKYAQRHNLRHHVNNKHGDVTQDLPRKHNYRYLTSRKGIKTGPRKPANEKKRVIKQRKRKSKNNTNSSPSAETSKSKTESSGVQIEVAVAPVDANANV